MADKNPIKELRDSINITQRELADALEVHHSYIANLESNLINFDEEALGEQSKIKMIFDKLAKWSNQDAAELLEQQRKCTMASIELVTQNAKNSLSRIPEEWINFNEGEHIEQPDELDWFLNELQQRCESGPKSPITILREAADITQRNFALATGASQAYIARVEKGELSISGPRTGSRVMIFVIDALASEDEDGHKFDALHESIYDLQENFMKAAKQKSKQNVIAAFEKLSKSKSNLKKD
jgi:predicted transcriptional regulator